MALRGKKPKETNPRLKLLMYGPPGVGKTTAALAMPRPYVIDTEDGTSHYGKAVEANGGAVFQTTSMAECIEEIRALHTENHLYRTLVIDPFTTLYDTLLDEGEKEVGADFGRHYGYANKQCKRWYALLSALDMNVVVTAHSKNEYGDGLKVIGHQADGWKKVPYLMDLVLELNRRENGDRVAEVMKTRLEEFPDRSKFQWSYDALAERYGSERMERAARQADLASPEQVAAFKGMMAQLSDDEIKRLRIDRALARVAAVEDFTAEAIQKGLDIMRQHLGQGAA